ncbi:unnamed protein product [Discula destructiva]
MAPRGMKRKSDETANNVEDAQDMASQAIATKTGSFPDQSTPRKKLRTGISLSQKQALIDNLQLEVTERARKLRAQYNLQAQGLRTRIEIRVNRIPMALRKAKMGELADKYKSGQHPQQVRPTASQTSLSQSARPPPVPKKDTPPVRAESSTSTKSHATTSSRPGPGRPPKRTSNEISGDSQENRGEAPDSEAPRKKLRAGADTKAVSNVLSPSSANIRTMSRPTPASKPPSVRPAYASENAPGPAKSPKKQGSVSNLFGSWAEKARSPKKKASAAALSSASGSVRGRKPGTASAAGIAKAAAAGTQPRVSGISESSESSTSTVVKKGADKKASPAKKAVGVMGSIRRGVAGAATKKAAEKKAAPASTATGRILRKRNP